jgi:hypothetical protein
LAFIAVAGFWPRFPQFCHPSRSRSSRERFCGRICVVTLLDGEDAQIHSADKFPMSRGNSCPRFCHGYGADTRFGLRSRRLAPRICVYCKQSNANNPLQTIQCKQSTANNLMQTIQLSSRAQRGISVFIPSAARDPGCHPERSRGISVVIPSATEGSWLSSRAQRRDLGFFGAASTTSGNSHHTP